MEKQNIRELHVVIYGHDMLKEAISRFHRNKLPFDKEMPYDFLCHDNTYLVFDGVFKLVEDPTPGHSIEVSLNDLFERAIDAWSC